MKGISVSNPLSLIAIFASLAESIALGILPFANHLTDNQIWAIIIFAVTFPTLMAGIFWWVLIFRHEHLFSPEEHGKDNYSENVLKLDNTRDSKQLLALREAAENDGKLTDFDAIIRSFLDQNYAYQGDVMTFIINPSNADLHKEVLKHVKRESKR